MYTHITYAVTAANTNHVLQRKSRALHFTNVGQNPVYIKLNSTGVATPAAAGIDQHVPAGQSWSVDSTDDVTNFSIRCAAGETTTVSTTEQSLIDV